MSEFNIVFGLEQVPFAAKELLKLYPSKRWFAFYGEMGAGKTTFITALCRELKCLDMVSSPTFAIINEYQTESGEEVFHFDFYRINSEDELYDIGFEEYLNGSGYCFIEWPEKAENLIDDSFLRVKITTTLDGRRKISIK